MPYSDRMQRAHLYSVFFAPRGLTRMADLGMQVAQQYLSPFDKLIGFVGEAGSGKSMMIKGMFPGLELTNDDSGVNVRPLPLLSAVEDNVGFYSPHTYHVDIHFEAAFTQLHELATAIKDAISIGKRVIVEHFDMIYPYMGRNAHLLIGIGEEAIVTRPTLFGPEPDDITDIVFKSIKYRYRVHSAEDLCGLLLRQDGITEEYIHSDVRHGFIFGFSKKYDIDIPNLEKRVNDMIAQDLPISFKDNNHINIGNEVQPCSGPRMHVRSAGEIKSLSLNRELIKEPITDRYLLVGVVGKDGAHSLSDLNTLV